MPTYGVIGERASMLISDLRGLVEKVGDQKSSEGVSLLDEAAGKLEQHASKVSFIGQVKAGKSTLINAFTGIEGLLPTEVNPWTAVITNLHFGHPYAADYTAHFKLFSEEEWDQMQNLDSDSRRLAAEYLPGFDRSVLETQVREMQKIARARLGNMYHHLLGKEHQFTKVDRALLERYVCAGHSSDGTNSNIGAGRLSNITKSADVYLPAGPFRTPMTVCDTPGINDPFLVRDEITTASLKSADVFVVTISAHQPLNAADIALLKMLSRHTQRTTVIFVNRIDELGDSIGEIQTIMDKLEARILKEISRPNYVICVGSAHWGQLAMTGTDEEVLSAVASKVFKDACKSLDVPEDLEPRAKLDIASGLYDLRETLSELTLEGPVSSLLKETSTQALAAVDLVSSMLEQKIRRFSREKQDGDLHVVEEAERQLNDRIDVLRTLQTKLDETARKGRSSIDEAMVKATDEVVVALETAVKEQVAKQVEDLNSALSARKRKDKWSLDYLALRESIDGRIIESYAASKTEFDTHLVDFALALNADIASVFTAVHFGSLVDTLPYGEIIPAFKPRSEIVELDLVESHGWQFWKNKRMSRDEALTRLRELIEVELADATEECSLTICTAINERRLAANDRFDQVVSSTVSMIERELESSIAELKEIGTGAGSKVVDDLIAKQRQMANDLISEYTTLQDAKSGLQRFLGATADTSEDVGDVHSSERKAS